MKKSIFLLFYLTIIIAGACLFRFIPYDFIYLFGFIFGNISLVFLRMSLEGDGDK